MDGGWRSAGSLAKWIARDQRLPLRQCRRENGLVEAELFAAELRNGGDDRLPIQPAADNGVAAVDIGSHAFKARRSELRTECLDGQLRFPADAAEEDEINGAFHWPAMFGEVW